MRQTSISIFLLLVACACFHAKAQTVSSLSWMTGCWELNGNGRVTIERWSAPTENLMIGTSQTVKGTKSVAFEFLRIVAGANGPSYIAKPSSAKEETTFAFLRSGEKEIVFENLKHDFPQRVIYRAEKAGSLFARIEGMQDGKLAGMDIPMNRVKCE